MSLNKYIKKTSKKLFPHFYEKLHEIKYELTAKKNFKSKYPQTLILPNKTKSDNKRGHSQSEQDYYIYNAFFKDKKDGFFCDVGANHPLRINNTLLFEKKGWKGFAFDPLPAARELWRDCREAIFFDTALSDFTGTTKFVIVDPENEYEGWENMLSSVKENQSVTAYKTKEIEVKTSKLEDFLNEKSINKIDYLSIDVEGHEIAVLNGIDFSKCKIMCISIENNRDQQSQEAIRSLLINKGFVYHARIWDLDDIFISSDIF